MDLAKTSLSTIQFDTLAPRLSNILRKLEQAGLFRALVVEARGTQVLLDTVFGQLKGQSLQTLSRGDEIQARIVPGRQQPSIQIEQLTPSQPELSSKAMAQLLKIAATQTTVAKPGTDPHTAAQAATMPLIIKVLKHDAQHSRLMIGQKIYPVARQPQLKPGEFLMLKPDHHGQPQLTRIDPQQLLKKAIAELLPRLQTSPRDSTGLSALQKLVSSILQLKPADLARPEQALQAATKAPSQLDAINTPPARTFTESTRNSESFPPQKAVNGRTGTGKIPTHAASRRVAPQRATKPATVPRGSQRMIRQLLQQLAAPIANARHIDAATIKQVLTRLTLIQPALETATQPGLTNIPQQLHLLQQLLQQSPQAFKELVAQIIHSHGNTADQHLDEARIQDISHLFRNELLHQLDQSSTVMLLQKSTLKLSQEQQQPLQINLNIPLQFKQDTVQLKLKLKQRQPTEQAQSQHWDVKLSFDLPLLGLISTHLLLQGSTLSASFWAVRDSTKTLIDMHLHLFRQQLINSGFEPGLLNSYPGQPVGNEDEPSWRKPDDNLLDIKV